jgi:hypothetical protein
MKSYGAFVSVDSKGLIAYDRPTKLRLPQTLIIKKLVGFWWRSLENKKAAARLPQSKTTRAKITTTGSSESRKISAV